MEITTELLLGIGSAVVAVGSAVLAIWGRLRTTRLAAELEELRLAEARRREVERVVSRYREPLARAAYDLQSRLYNILEQDLIERFYDAGDERERSYVVDNTAFLVAQYLAWTEIIRKDIQFIDLGEDEQTRRLARLQDDVYAVFQTSELADPTFRLFAGEQRAIGERMIREGASGPECIGYAAFTDELQDSPPVLIEALRADVRALSERGAAARPRLVALQNTLIDLLAFLDPEYVRFPRERRAKVS